jgi:hypothetical protein
VAIQCSQELALVAILMHSTEDVQDELVLGVDAAGGGSHLVILADVGDGRSLYFAHIIYNWYALAIIVKIARHQGLLTIAHSSPAPEGKEGSVAASCRFLNLKGLSLTTSVGLTDVLLMKRTSYLTVYSPTLSAFEVIWMRSSK